MNGDSAVESSRVESSVECQHRHWISGYESVSVVGLSCHYITWHTHTHTQVYVCVRAHHGHVGPCKHTRHGQNG